MHGTDMTGRDTRIMLVVVTVTALVATTCGSPGARPGTDRGGGQGGVGTAAPAPKSPAAAKTPVRAMSEIVEKATSAREIWHFDFLGEMVATSDAVVDATVVAVNPGRVVILPPDGRTEFSEVTLRVSNVLAGEAPTEVVLEEDGILATKSELGDRGVYFIVRKQDRPKFYRLVNS